MKNSILIIFCWIAFSNTKAQIVLENKQPNSFPLSNTVIYVDENDFALVKRSAELLQQDIEAVTGKKVLLKKKMSA